VEVVQNRRPTRVLEWLVVYQALQQTRNRLNSKVVGENWPLQVGFYEKDTLVRKILGKSYCEADGNRCPPFTRQTAANRQDFGGESGTRACVNRAEELIPARE
jgi:hypothetical protein